MMVFETMDYSMLGIINDGSHVPMHQPMKKNIKDGNPIEKHAHEFNDEDRSLVALDVIAL